MPAPDLKLIQVAFIRELEAFKQNGYQFNGSGKALFEGTQREAFDAYLKGIEDNHTEGYFEIPTGVGKTALFIAVIGCYLRATENIPNAPRVLIHEPTADLVLQTARAFADFMPSIAKLMEADDERGREIDWANSQIDVHYHVRRGAKNNPKVLITTYQSQAADERIFDSAKRLHKPEEFGFIIHDEAHYLTGRKFGPAAVDKFRGAIQLGVTATPEYSEDKTVANKLKHRYYHLPLNVAIERGDLCHVRPILLKTEVVIDEKKAQGFLKEQRDKGKPLTHAQLEKLLNQAGRNKAIIEAYITGIHPDTKEHFLGQTGMIFAGGITHCNDFIKQAEEVLKKPKYKDVRKWLADEGLALIAPIHSQVPKEGTEIFIGGEKRLCTKEEIKELHRQGKILLLISDQELKLGTDFPMDSFIAETVDRFSVPDATQRVGRGFRVDRGNADYNFPPNPGKSCAVLNVIDNNTHTIYEGSSYYPIHAIEILHGAEHRPPGRRPGAFTRFQKQPPEVTEGLESPGFELITRIDEIKHVTRKFKEGKKKEFPLKTAEWWSRTRDIPSQPGGARGEVKAALEEMEQAYEAWEKTGKNGILTQPYKDIPIKMQRMQSGVQIPICFSSEDIKAAGFVRGELPKKEVGWWAGTDIQHQFGGNRNETKNALSQMEEKYKAWEEEGNQGTLILRHNNLPVQVQRMQAGVQTPICFWHKNIEAAGLLSVELPNKEDGWWTANDISQKPGGQRTEVRDLLRDMGLRYREWEKKNHGVLTLEFDGKPIQVQRRQTGSGTAICFWHEDVKAASLVDEKLQLPKKEAGWWSSTEIGHQPGGQRDQTQAALSRLEQEYEGWERAGNIGMRLGTYENASVKTQRMQSGTKKAMCFWQEDVEAAGLVRKALPLKGEDWKSRKDIKSILGGLSVKSKAVLDQMELEYQTWEGNGNSGILSLDHDGKAVQVQRMQAGPTTPICFSRADLKLAGLIRDEVPQKNDEWLNRTRDLYNTPGGTREETKAAAKRLEEEYQAWEKAGNSGMFSAECNGTPVHIQRMQSGVHAAICFNKKDLIAAGLVRAELPPKQANWLTSNEVKRVPGGGRAATLSVVDKMEQEYAAWESADNTGVLSLEHNGTQIHIQRLQSGSFAPICFASEDLKAAGLVKSEPEDFKSKPIKFRGIKPGDETVRRGERSRD